MEDIRRRVARSLTVTLIGNFKHNERLTILGLNEHLGKYDLGWLTDGSDKIIRYVAHEWTVEDLLAPFLSDTCCDHQFNELSTFLDSWLELKSVR